MKGKSAYQMFCKDHPELDSLEDRKERSKKLRELWKALDTEKKAEYVEKEKEELEKYNEEKRELEKRKEERKEKAAKKAERQKIPRAREEGSSGWGSEGRMRNRREADGDDETAGRGVEEGGREDVEEIPEDGGGGEEEGRGEEEGAD